MGQVFNIPEFFHKLEELDSDLQIAESDIRRNEKIKGNANLCISAILRLETALLDNLQRCKSIQKDDLDIMLDLHAQTLMQLCQNISGQSLELLYARMEYHEKHFEEFFERRYPNSPLPPPEPEGAIYTPEIVDRYKHLLQNKPQEKDWPLVSRKHLRLCLYMQLQMKDALQALVRGNLPQIDMPVGEQNKPLPEELDTPQAMEVMEKMRCGGLLDDKYQPVKGTSLTDKAVLAHHISRQISGTHKWAVFQRFWGVKNLSSKFSKALEQKKTGDIFDLLNNL